MTNNNNKDVEQTNYFDKGDPWRYGPRRNPYGRGPWYGPGRPPYGPGRPPYGPGRGPWGPGPGRGPCGYNDCNRPWGRPW